MRGECHDSDGLEPAYVGLGANLGDPSAQLRWALDQLAKLGPVRVSSFYRTEPLGQLDQPWYLNAVACLKTRLEPIELLRTLKQLERQAGRAASDERWSSRLLDLDLLLHGERVMSTRELELPHPSYPLRRFVLEPLAELSPGLRDPRSGLSVQEILRTLNDPLRVLCLGRADLHPDGSTAPAKSPVP